MANPSRKRTAERYWVDDRDRLHHVPVSDAYGQFTSSISEDDKETERLVDDYCCGYCGANAYFWNAGYQRRPRPQERCEYCGAVGQWIPVAQADPYLLGSWADECLIYSLDHVGKPIVDSFYEDLADYHKDGIGSAQTGYENMLFCALKRNDEQAAQLARIKLAWYRMLDIYCDIMAIAWCRKDNGEPEDQYGFPQSDRQKAGSRAIETTIASLGNLGNAPDQIAWSLLFLNLSCVLANDAYPDKDDCLYGDGDEDYRPRSWTYGPSHSPVSVSLTPSDSFATPFSEWRGDVERAETFLRFRFALLTWAATMLAQRIWMIEAKTPNIPDHLDRPSDQDHGTRPRGRWTGSCYNTLRHMLDALDYGFGLKDHYRIYCNLTPQQLAEYDATCKLSACVDHGYSHEPISPWDTQLRRIAHRRSYRMSVYSTVERPESLLDQDERDLRQAERIVRSVRNPSAPFERYTSRLLRRLRKGVDYDRNAIPTSRQAESLVNMIPRVMFSLWCLTSTLIVILVILRSTQGWFLGAAINFVTMCAAWSWLTRMELVSYCPADAKSNMADAHDPGLYRQGAFDFVAGGIISVLCTVAGLIAAAIVLLFAHPLLT